MKLLAIGRDDAGCLLAAMLERMQPKRRVSGGIFMVKNSEDAAFFVEMIVFEWVGRDRVH